MLDTIPMPPQGQMCIPARSGSTLQGIGLSLSPPRSEAPPRKTAMPDTIRCARALPPRVADRSVPDRRAWVVAREATWRRNVRRAIVGVTVGVTVGLFLASESIERDDVAAATAVAVTRTTDQRPSTRIVGHVVSVPEERVPSSLARSAVGARQNGLDCARESEPTAEIAFATLVVISLRCSSRVVSLAALAVPSA